MERLANDDPAAAITLYQEFGEPIRKAVARRARHIGAKHLSPEDIEGMALDFCLALIGRAGAWDPDGGALPWVWGVKLLNSVVDGHVGQYHGPLEGTEGPEDPGTRACAVDDRTLLEVLEDLGRRDPLCGLLLAALRRVATPRDIRILFDYCDARHAGDPSPSHTVGALYGVRPEVVRKVAQRVRNRVRALAAADAAFAPLLSLPFLHAQGRSA
jgi:hypothetical protein